MELYKHSIEYESNGTTYERFKRGDTDSYKHLEVTGLVQFINNVLVKQEVYNDPNRLSLWFTMAGLLSNVVSTPTKFFQQSSDPVSHGLISYYDEYITLFLAQAQNTENSKLSILVFDLNAKSTAPVFHSKYLFDFLPSLIKGLSKNAIEDASKRALLIEISPKKRSSYQEADCFKITSVFEINFGPATEFAFGEHNVYSLNTKFNYPVPKYHQVNIPERYFMPEISDKDFEQEKASDVPEIVRKTRELLSIRVPHRKRKFLNCDNMLRFMAGLSAYALHDSTKIDSTLSFTIDGSISDVTFIRKQQPGELLQYNEPLSIVNRKFRNFIDLSHDFQTIARYKNVVLLQVLETRSTRVSFDIDCESFKFDLQNSKQISYHQTPSSLPKIQHDAMILKKQISLFGQDSVIFNILGNLAPSDRSILKLIVTNKILSFLERTGAFGAFITVILDKTQLQDEKPIGVLPSANELKKNRIQQIDGVKYVILGGGSDNIAFLNQWSIPKTGTQVIGDNNRENQFEIHFLKHKTDNVADIGFFGRVSEFFKLQQLTTIKIDPNELNKLVQPNFINKKLRKLGIRYPITSNRQMSGFLRGLLSGNFHVVNPIEQDRSILAIIDHVGMRSIWLKHVLYPTQKEANRKRGDDYRSFMQIAVESVQSLPRDQIWKIMPTFALVEQLQGKGKAVNNVLCS